MNGSFVRTIGLARAKAKKEVRGKILFLEKTELNLCQTMDQKNRFLVVPITFYKYIHIRF